MTMNVVTMFANMDLLKEAGWDHVPETYDELIVLCDKLIEAGKSAEAIKANRTMLAHDAECAENAESDRNAEIF